MTVAFALITAILLGVGMGVDSCKVWMAEQAEQEKKEREAEQLRIDQENAIKASEQAAEAAKQEAYQIQNVPVIPQDVLKAGCETYACTVLLQYHGFDIDEYQFAENWLDIHPVYYGDDGNRYGPDMNSAQAGDVYTGWGIFSPAMAKCMNKYLSSVKSDLKAYSLENVSLDDLCKDYVYNDLPVMVWATTNMQESYDKDTWYVDYVDENAKTKIGDTFTWRQNEHCLVLMGYDKENYYFSDSVARKIEKYDKKTVDERYTEIGRMAIVVK